MSLAIVCDICERFVRTGTPVPVLRVGGAPHPLDGWQQRWMGWDNARGEASTRWDPIDMSNGVETGFHRCPACARKDKEEAGSSDLVERLRAVVREEIARLAFPPPAPPAASADAALPLVPTFTPSAERKEEEE